MPNPNGEGTTTVVRRAGNASNDEIGQILSQFN